MIHQGEETILKQLTGTFLLLITFSSSGFCQSVTVTWTDTPPVVDGLLGEAEWADSEPLVEPFIQQRPDCGEHMTEPTEVRLLYDDACIYIGFTMHDEHPEEFTRMIAPRDEDFSSEWIGIWLDTYNDDNNAYYFFVCVDNVQQDGRLCEVSGWDNDWDAVWNSATSISDSGWTAEFAIPLSALRIHAK